MIIKAQVQCIGHIVHMKHHHILKGLWMEISYVAEDIKANQRNSTKIQSELISTGAKIRPKVLEECAAS